jgi:hypothetical protein
MINNSKQYNNSGTNKIASGNSSNKRCTASHGDKVTIQTIRHSTTNKQDGFGISSKAATKIPTRIRKIDEESITNGERDPPSNGGHG